MGEPAIVWFRRDLRLDDHPALDAALARGAVVIPVYIADAREEGDWPLGGASRWWLHHSLRALAAALEGCGSRLLVRQGDAGRELLSLAAECGARTVYFGRRYEPAARAGEQELLQRLQQGGLEAATFNTSVWHEPSAVRSVSGGAYQVFTAYYRACQVRLDQGTPAPPPARMAPAERWPRSMSIEDLGLLPRWDWAGGLRQAWQPGETGAQAALDRFLKAGAADYDRLRDRPDREGTSLLSPHLHWGEIGPRRLWQRLRRVQAAGNRAGPVGASEGLAAFLRELHWREFAHHLLWHFPQTARQPLRPEFQRFPWVEDDEGYRAWCRGQTGYPIVDAGMRQLWATGWMHNRVRMIAASFLVKDLQIHWERGAAWFWDTLVDADLANNTLGWQWTAGCGADAAPYFRVFNPVLQAERFDPEGSYVRRWVPELAKLASRWLHRPWQAPAAVCEEAGVHLGRTYPAPIVDHETARQRALAAFDRIKRRRAPRV